MSHAELMTDPVIVGSYTAIADASALVGSPSTRHVGTLGGNVMNGSPAMDTGAPLTVLGAAAELRSVNGSRTVALDELWAGPGRTTADPANSWSLCTFRRLRTDAVVPMSASNTGGRWRLRSSVRRLR